MLAPVWLPETLAVLMLLLAGIAVWRGEVTARPPGHVAADLESDALTGVLALAVAAMLVHWLDVLPQTAWIVALNLAGYWFAARLVLLPRGSLHRAAGRARARMAVVGTAGCAIAVYMRLAGVAPAGRGTVNTSHVMAGMAGAAAGAAQSALALPGLGVVLAAVLCAYAITALNRVSSSSPAVLRPRAAATTGAAAGGPAGPAGPLQAVLRSERAAELGRVLVAVTMAYAILAALA
jgi:hypothetical protein